MSDPPHNRLASASSPYLRQHAGNPVDWYPWGPEALERARAEDRPIFLSIGYSACHWCHVMERESFSDPAIAVLLNDLFICIKVDREERPDLDAVYMAAVQAMTGTGGWPLTAFLTPAAEPFFGGTYFPPERRWGRPSLREVATSVATAWTQRRGELVEAARELVTRLASVVPPTSPGGPDVATLLATFVTRAANEFDPANGGFGAAPKFPSPSRLFLLLAEATREPEAERMLGATLDAMAAGGMYDWVGGGFHRYSVDERWLVPHFEKMLYDNALLVRLYGEAATRLAQPRWMKTATDTADYLLREMLAPEGGFYSSSDADSAGGEGLFFTWTPEEIRAALPIRHADAVIAVCRLDDRGNFEGGRSVLRPSAAITETASRLGMPEVEVEHLLGEARALLRAARDARPRPTVDEKLLAGWNGMTAWALAYLGAAAAQDSYLVAAQGVGRFLLARLHPDRPLERSWRGGVDSGAESLEDVAWVMAGFLALFEADADPTWLGAALQLAERRVPRYRSVDGGVHDTPDDGERLVLRPRSAADGATPSSAGVVAATLARLAAVTGRADLGAQAGQIVAAERTLLVRYPEVHASLLDAAAAMASPPSSVVIAGAPDWRSTAALLAAARRCADPRWPILHAPSWPPPTELLGLVPDLAGKSPAAEREAAAYVCRAGACMAPTSDPARLAELLQS